MPVSESNSIIDNSFAAGATRAGERLHTFRIDLISVSGRTRSGLAHSATHGGGVQATQPRFIPHERIGFFGIAGDSQAPLPETLGYAKNDHRADRALCDGPLGILRQPSQKEMRTMNWTCRGVPVPMGVVFTVDWMIAN